jgi:hypothetical protein
MYPYRSDLSLDLATREPKPKRQNVLLIAHPNLYHRYHLLRFFDLTYFSRSQRSNIEKSMVARFVIVCHDLVAQSEYMVPGPFHLYWHGY